MRHTRRPVNIRLGHLIREIRVRNGFTQEEFGSLIKRSDSYVARLEGGSYLSLPPDVVDRICRATGTEPSAILRAMGYLT
jgi:transcriptional regulator with XRE-family HTH domain